MKDFFLQLLGFDTSRIPPDAQTEFLFANPQQSWRVFVLVAIVAAVVYGVMYLYRREIDTCPRPVRIALGCIRAAVLLLLALVFLDPALSVSQRRTVQPQVIVLLDESQSMSIPDRYLDDSAVAPVAAALGRTPEEIRTDTPTRAKLINDLLARDDGRFIRDLAARGNVRVFTFANKSNQIDTKRSTADTPTGSQDKTGEAPENAPPVSYTLPPLQPTGQGTLVAKAIRDALKSLSGSPVAGIVIVSDGQDTAKADDPLAAADLAATQTAPIFTIGVGDPSKPRNLKVVEVFADDQVWQADPFEIQVSVQAQGIDAGTAEIELVEQPLSADGAPTGSSTVIERRNIKLPADGAQESLAFKHKAKKEGQYAYTIQVPVQTGELLDTDNAKTVKVRVLKEQARVLLIAGGPSWEYRLVEGLFTRDPTINVSGWLQSMDVDMPQEGDTVIDKLPFAFDQLNKYDLVMMFDPDPTEFNEAWFDVLKKMLSENAAGFLYVAGPKFSNRFLTDSKTRGIRDVLPVRLGEASAIEVEALTGKNNREWPLAVVPSALDHPILRFDTDLAANKARWDKMPGIFWSFPALDLKPAARALIDHSDPNLRRSHGARPLLVAGQYGSGRTAYMGFNGTWRWRRLGRDAEYFNKYWVQLCRYLVEGKLLASKRRGTIETGGEKFNVGDVVAVTARLFDPAFQPLTLRTVRATLKGSGGAAEVPVELRAVQNQPGQFEGSVVAMQLGPNELSVELPGDKPEDTVRVTKQFEVELPRIEYEDTRLNKQLLIDLAERSGGKYFDVDRIGDVAAAIPDRATPIVVAGKPAELWDTNRLLIVLVGLLTVEWALRKRFKLM